MTKGPRKESKGETKNVGISGSNPAEGTNIRLLCFVCVTASATSWLLIPSSSEYKTGYSLQTTMIYY
jgi:hypothetical protein